MYGDGRGGEGACRCRGARWIEAAAAAAAPDRGRVATARRRAGSTLHSVRPGARTLSRQGPPHGRTPRRLPPPQELTAAAALHASPAAGRGGSASESGARRVRVGVCDGPAPASSRPPQPPAAAAHCAMRPRPLGRSVAAAAAAALEHGTVRVRLRDHVGM